MLERRVANGASEGSADRESWQADDTQMRSEGGGEHTTIWGGGMAVGSVGGHSRAALPSSSRAVRRSGTSVARPSSRVEIRRTIVLSTHLSTSNSKSTAERRHDEVNM